MFTPDETFLAEIKRVAATAPPMSHEQLSNLSVLLGGLPLPPESADATVHAIGRGAAALVAVETEKAA